MVSLSKADLVSEKMAKRSFDEYSLRRNSRIITKNNAPFLMELYNGILCLHDLSILFDHCGGDVVEGGNIWETNYLDSS